MAWAGSRGSSLHFRYQVKFFYLCQLAYWLHALPELYFQKVRKVRARGRFLGEEALERGWVERAERLIWLFCPCQEEIPRQLRCISLYLLHIAGAYLLK